MRALPYGFRRVLVLRSGQGRRRRRPHVAARRERAALGARPLEQRVDVLAADAKCAADADRRQDPLIDPVADRLRRDLELLGNLGNGEELSLSG